MIETSTYDVWLHTQLLMYCIFSLGYKDKKMSITGICDLSSVFDVYSSLIARRQYVQSTKLMSIT